MLNSNWTEPTASRRAKVSIALIVATLGFSGLGLTPASAADPIPPNGSWQADAMAEAATPAELKAEVADGELRLLVIRDDAGEPDATVVNVSSAKSLAGTLKVINQDESVVSVQVDEKVSLLAPAMTSFVSTAAPTDAYVQWNYSALRLGEIHTSLTGTGITVAVIDSGVNRTGPELNGAGQVLDGCDWVISPTNVCTGTGVTDQNGHGTHVAGIIAAKNDGLGVTGVAPNATILPLRVLDANGSGYLSDVAAAIDYAVAQNADVINMSLGGTTNFSLIRLAVTRASTAGVIVIAAAGNSGASGATSYPAAYPEVIAVAATTSAKVIATYSNGGSYVDVAAPGSEILSSWPTGTGYARISGTSMAAPHVAGLAALLLQKNVLSAPLSTPAAIKNQIETTALKNDAGGYGITDYSLARYGAGMIDIYAALDCSAGSCVPPTPPVVPPVVDESAPSEPGLPGLVSQPALDPTFGTPTRKADGFQVQISNYDADFTYGGTTANGSVDINASGLVTVSGVAASTSSDATITTTRTGYDSGSALITATSLNAALVPTFGTPTRKADGFQVQISNYDADFTYGGTATSNGSVVVSGLGLVTVSGVAANTSSDATITTTSTGYAPGSATITATSLSAAPPAPEVAPAPAAAPVAAAPVAAAPVAVQVIGISKVVKRKFTLTVDSPAGSKTWIQRKSGTKWVTLQKITSKSSSVIKVGRSGTYRIQIVGPSRKDVSSAFKVK